MYFLIYLIYLLIFCVDLPLPVWQRISSHFGNPISQHTGLSNADEITDKKCFVCIVWCLCIDSMKHDFLIGICDPVQPYICLFV